MTQTATAPEGATSSTATAPAATGTTQAAADAGQGQAPGTQGTGTSTAAAPATQAEETFFDPKSVPEELKPAYNQMRNAFTKKMQGLSQDKNKVEAYNAFISDPVANMQRFAKQYGYNLTRAEAAAAVNTPGQQGTDLKNWQPQSWDEVVSTIEQRAIEKMNERLAPVFQGVQQVTAHNIEQQLTQIDENWRMYEDDMKANISAHPTLVKDVAKLYRMSVPEEVLTRRAVQTALKKLEDKAKGAQVHGSQNTARSAPAPKAAKNFQEAVQFAREQLTQTGR